MRGYYQFLKIDEKYHLNANEISASELEEIGEGNFGTVYKGNLVRENLTIQIAIKVSKSINLKSAKEVDNFFEEVNSILKKGFRN